MLIRRNMTINVPYQQLKDYEVFKELTKVNDVMILKEVLPFVVKKITFDLDKQIPFKNSLIYLPQEYYQATLEPPSMDWLRKFANQSDKVKFFVIEKKTYNILRYLFYKKIPCMQMMRNYDKLNFFYRAQINSTPYGSYIYRKDDPIIHIFYLIKGEIQISKSIDEKEINLVNVHEGTFFGIYEFGNNKTKRVLNARSSENQTMVLSIPLEMLTQLFGKDQNQIFTQLLALNSEINKIKKLQNQKSSSQIVKSKSTNFIKAYEFHSRLAKFSADRKMDKKDPVFEYYIENKSLLFKIKDSNDSFPREKKQNSKVFSNFHKSQSMIKYCNRLNDHRMKTLGPLLYQQFAQNMKKCTKPQVSKGSEILSSRLKKKFFQSKRNYDMDGIGPIPTYRESQLL